MTVIRRPVAMSSTLLVTSPVAAACGPWSSWTSIVTRRASTDSPRSRAVSRIGTGRMPCPTIARPARAGRTSSLPVWRGERPAASTSARHARGRRAAGRRTTMAPVESAMATEHRVPEPAGLRGDDAADVDPRADRHRPRRRRSRRVDRPSASGSVAAWVADGLDGVARGRALRRGRGWGRRTRACRTRARSRIDRRK